MGHALPDDETRPRGDHAGASRTVDLQLPTVAVGCPGRGGALPAHRDGRRHRPGSSHSHRRTDRRRFSSWTVPPPLPDTLAERAAAQGAILASITDPRLVRSHRRWNDDDWTSCMAYARRADRAQQRLLD
jgi:hypothetical protein